MKENLEQECMEKEFLPYKQSFELKKLGFDEACFDYYIPNKNDDPISKIFNTYELGKHNSNTNTIYKNGVVSRPLFHQVFSWFRKKYNLCGWTEEDYFKGRQLYNYNISRYKTLNIIGDITESYEESELECINKLIEIVKKEQ